MRKKLYLTILNEKGKNRNEARIEILEKLKELEFIEKASAVYLGLFEEDVKRDFKYERVWDGVFPLENK